jgi:hypothetical protein
MYTKEFYITLSDVSLVIWKTPVSNGKAVIGMEIRLVVCAAVAPCHVDGVTGSILGYIEV